MATTDTLKLEATDTVHKLLKQGRGAQGTAGIYDEVASKFDGYMEVLGFKAPITTAEEAAKLLKSNYTARVLDVGAGTGLVGIELAKLGYKNIDAVDASEGLLKIAESKGVYGKLAFHFVGEQKMPFPDHSYDMAVLCGAMGENHIPRSGLKDIIRVVKPGGFIVNVFREEAMRFPWYEDGLQPYIDQLEKDGSWKLVARKTFPNFMPGKEGLVLIHQVL